MIRLISNEWIKNYCNCELKKWERCERAIYLTTYWDKEIRMEELFCFIALTVTASPVRFSTTRLAVSRNLAKWLSFSPENVNSSQCWSQRTRYWWKYLSASCFKANWLNRFGFSHITDRSIKIGRIERYRFQISFVHW